MGIIRSSFYDGTYAYFGGHIYDGTNVNLMAIKYNPSLGTFPWAIYSMD